MGRAWRVCEKKQRRAVRETWHGYEGAFVLGCSIFSEFGHCVGRGKWERAAELGGNLFCQIRDWCLGRMEDREEFNAWFLGYGLR